MFLFIYVISVAFVCLFVTSAFYCASLVASIFVSITQESSSCQFPYYLLLSCCFLSARNVFCPSRAIPLWAVLPLYRVAASLLVCVFVIIASV